MKYLIPSAFCIGLLVAAVGAYEEPPIAFIEDLEFDSDPRIVYGSIAAPGQFPHQVANKFRVLGIGDYFCGASLICDSWVLTAAHCAQNASRFLLYFGSVNQSQATEQGRVVLLTMEKYIHPAYNSTNLNNNIALLRLQQKIRFTDKIQPIPLATHRTADRQRVTVSGWGRTSRDSDISPVLRYVDLDTISNKECEGVYGPNRIKNETLCCRGRPFHATCNGDSGGPLIERDASGKWVQSGIINFFHVTGCDNGYPSGNLRVQSYLGWIRETIGDTCTLPN